MNGRQSKGPVTEEGKRVSSQNACKPLDLMRLVMLSPEDMEDLKAGIKTDTYLLYLPENQREEILVKEIAEHRFRIHLDELYLEGLMKLRRGELCEEETGSKFSQGAYRDLERDVTRHEKAVTQLTRQIDRLRKEAEKKEKLAMAREKHVLDLRKAAIGKNGYVTLKEFKHEIYEELEKIDKIRLAEEVIKKFQNEPEKSLSLEEAESYYSKFRPKVKSPERKEAQPQKIVEGIENRKNEPTAKKTKETEWARNVVAGVTSLNQ